MKLHNITHDHSSSAVSHAISISEAKKNEILNIWRRAAPQYGKLVNGCCKDEANAQIWENSFGNVERIPLYDFLSFNKQ